MQEAKLWLFCLGCLHQARPLLPFESASTVPLEQEFSYRQLEFICERMVVIFSLALSKHMPLLSLFQTLNPPFPDEQEILPEHLLKCSLFCGLSFVCPTRTEEHSWWLKILCVSYTQWGSESTLLRTWARQLNWRGRIRTVKFYLKWI